MQDLAWPGSHLGAVSLPAVVVQWFYGCGLRTADCCKWQIQMHGYRCSSTALLLCV